MHVPLDHIAPRLLLFRDLVLEAITQQLLLQFALLASLELFLRAKDLQAARFVQMVHSPHRLDRVPAPPAQLGRTALLRVCQQ